MDLALFATNKTAGEEDDNAVIDDDQVMDESDEKKKGKKKGKRGESPAPRAGSPSPGGTPPSAPLSSTPSDKGTNMFEHFYNIVDKKSARKRGRPPTGATKPQANRRKLAQASQSDIQVAIDSVLNVGSTVGTKPRKTGKKSSKSMLFC
jgi:hypothetical protein